MSLTLVSGWIFAEKRRLVQIFPEKVRRVWNEWEVRVMVLLSLVFQICLIYLGSRRKYNTSNWLRITLWSAYLMSDWVATVALGILFSSQGSLCNCTVSDGRTTLRNELMAFWAPFLLLHLGGPDTITAYALADNELWIRHLLGLIFQLGVAVNITLLSWRSTWLSYLTATMLLAGTIKYGERSWSLRCANRDKFRDSVLNSRDPGPSYAKFMEEFRLKEAEGYHVTANEVIEINVVPQDEIDGNNESDSSMCVLRKANSFFRNFKRLFVDLILSFQDRDMSRSFFQKAKSRTAFQVIEVELGFAYDIFYTKAPINYTRWGFFFRFLTFTLTCLVFIAFCITVSLGSQHHDPIDLVITYILLSGAICLEISAAKSVVSSDWTSLWFSEHSKTLFSRSISCIPPFQKKPKKRWSKSMNQYNLLHYSLNLMPFVFHRLVPFHNQLQDVLQMIREKLENLRQLKIRTQVSDELKELIFDHFLEKSRCSKEPTSMCTCSGGGGGGFREKHEQGCAYRFSWTKLEFDHSILIWHIATSLCYILDDGEQYKKIDPCRTDEVKLLGNRVLHSKQLADYMLYVLVIRPFMLPIGIGMIRFRDTCAEAFEYFQDKGIKTVKDAADMLTEVCTKVDPIKVKGDRSKSVLFEACKLVTSLQKMEKNEKWELVSNVWVEIVGYAASNCRGYYHAQQLRKGGELLTHVWLLMAHLGITEHFQISLGHVRAKMAVR